MPSTGFYSFLRQEREEIMSKKENVSMPSTGFYSFLQNHKKERRAHNMCQCPQRASNHFYGSLSEALILLASES